MTLGTKQRIFTRLIGMLILKAYEIGYEMTFGDAYRSPEQAAANAAAGIGIANSLHTKRLAVDLNLFKDGVYLTNSAAYKPLGEWWEAQSSPGFECCWGGRFKRADGNHFSVEHEGVK
jgi:hypothetical protein